MTTYDGSIEWPHLEQYSDQPVFNTKAVVQQTGVPAPTLRAWERRYSLLVPERANNAYRLYSERDVALIRWLKECVDSGISISHAVALFRHLEQQQRDPTVASADVYFDIPAPPAFQVALNSPDPDTEQFVQREKDLQDASRAVDLSWAQANQLNSSNVYPTVYTMQMARAQLIEIFQDMDEQAAQVLMGSLLSFYSVEQVCCELIMPTLWDIGRLWAEGHVTVSVEHFASNFFRAVLTNMFHVTRGPSTGPIVLTCCAPGEPHELSMLMLSLFLRRRGIRVVYLGQSIETTGLLHTIKKLSPSAICISLTLPAYMPALMSLGRQLQHLPGSRPAMIFGGQAFLQFPQPEKLIPEGIYMDGDFNKITARLQSIVFEASARK
ncbi:MerR family transcriptional regulator [Dictyobacter kobayashii]|uniref:MerR family transcriptional regulator n=1 Tax=Dictyobacter kobayashii TaxID=2014872 RepID=A0A402AGW6_9CHLR|nr:MerR family transcriptional regulator [Dictyobacter kobayashii]GCE18294.1 MerR family transcriptional regulator [Dictyobacter kobayashii]